MAKLLIFRLSLFRSKLNLVRFLFNVFNLHFNTCGIMLQKNDPQGGASRQAPAPGYNHKSPPSKILQNKSLQTEFDWRVCLEQNRKRLNNVISFYTELEKEVSFARNKDAEY